MQARDEMQPPSDRDCQVRGELFVTSGNGTSGT